MSEPISGLDADDNFDAAAILRFGWSYRYLIAMATILGGAIAVSLALNAPMVYRSQVVVTQVTDSGMSAAASLADQFGGLASLAGVNLGGGATDQDAKAILMSRKLAQEFITRNSLVPDLSVGKKKNLTLWMAVEKFKKDVVAIREDKRSGTITVMISWRDPVVAARWANEFVSLANDVIRARALEDSTRNIAFLTAQVRRTDVIELQKVMYNLIENESKTLMLANARTEYAFAVVDPAVAPEIRISPRRTVMVLFGLAVGLIIGFAIAFAHNAYVKKRS